MPYQPDVPATSRFHPVPVAGNATWSELTSHGLSDPFQALAKEAPQGECVFYGMPFQVGACPATVRQGEAPLTLALPALCAGWLVLAHTADFRPNGWPTEPLVGGERGTGYLGEESARYVFIYADGSEETASIRLGCQIGLPPGRWGHNCTEAVFHGHYQPLRWKDDRQDVVWGWSQCRIEVKQATPYVLWLWAWQNPFPERPLVGLRLEPVAGAIVLAAIAAGDASAHPLRWQRRQKAVLTLPPGETLEPALDRDGLLRQLRLDLGVVISATARPVYPNDRWPESYNNQLPVVAEREVIVEYTAHPDASFHLADGTIIPVAEVEAAVSGVLTQVKPAERRVRLRVTERGSSRPVAVKLHVHGEAGEYLPPMDRHRIPNPNWFEDYSADFLHQGIHLCSYISGETELKLPLGKVYVEIAKGFEIKPVRQIIEIGEATDELTIELERVLPWAERGWRSADTHVHFLSPQTGLLEGAAEGVNVVNLLASQWGELYTNIGDFDGQTTHGSGEYLLRVGTENRQHVLGHISLIGYEGRPILPLCTGGPEEAAFGDPVEVLITEWAQQCRAQNGLVVMPHWPRPRLENAATLLTGAADAVEFCSWAQLYDGIDPYSLADWYRFLNQGILVAAVGGTDKMAAITAVGTLRSYARLAPGEAFTYEAWKQAVRRAETFVTNGPLMEMHVDGQPMGSRLPMTAAGGTVEVTWEVASATMPMSRVELIANGMPVDGMAIDPWHAAGSFTVKVDRSSWLALLIRGHYADQPEVVCAHSTPVMIDVAGSEFRSAADALSILRQVEGAIAYLDTLATRADPERYRQMRLLLTSAHRDFHNRLHRQGIFHDHTPTADHPEHH